MVDFDVTYREKACWICGPDNPDGFKVKFFTDDEGVFFKLSFDSKYQGYDGIVHGGMISTMLDEVMANCFFLKGIRCLTVEINVRFLKPLPVNHDVIIKGIVVEQTKRIGLAVGYIDDDKGVRYAEGRGRFFLIDESKTIEDIKDGLSE